jgi:hypothetical protein
MAEETMTLSYVLSALVGGVIALALKVVGEIILDHYRTRHERDSEKMQREMLRTMLDPEVMRLLPNSSGGTGVEWRTFDTLMSVIGANETTTKRLLLEIGARGSTKDGRSWALIEHQPLDPRKVRSQNENLVESF